VQCPSLVVVDARDDAVGVRCVRAPVQ
jgi:hypothetical protein